MGWTTIEAHWNELKGAAKSRWTELTDDDLDRIDGKCDELIGTLQFRYDKGKDEVETEVARWARRAAQGIGAPEERAR